ncbi:membrane hypothetical protein [Candidatus Terasakiella magnetica]|uniref:Conjugal transfer protein TraG n=1 Tax=Candidatus Terasakiella magnetica TaxID=1867952 RepID=A0A1C3RLJ1_9PROT|nr:type IV secretory system conjugative DNA transfer family protein [Candidatus Terasakiella magnetica]SCA58144.1 membrane hypothetical protein [Candidatus Terasakiella magnetica]
MLLPNLSFELGVIAPLLVLPGMIFIFIWKKPIPLILLAITSYVWIGYCLQDAWLGFQIIAAEWDDLSVWREILPQLDRPLIFVSGIALLFSSYFLAQGIFGANIKKLGTSEKLTGADRAKSGTHGTGRLMSQKEAKKVYGDKEGVILAQSDDGKFLRLRNPGHIFTECVTRGGKGVSSVCVNGLEWDGPVVCLDPKIENFFIWGRNRWAKGHKVCLLDPLNIASKIEKHFEKNGVAACVSRTSLNVLDFLDPQSSSFYSQVQEVAANLKPTASEKVTDPFWVDAPAGIIVTFIIWVCCAPEEEVEGPRTLETVRNYCFHKDPDTLIENWIDRTEIANGSLSRAIIDLNEFKGNMRGYASIVKIARTWLAFLEDVGTCKTLCGEIGTPFKSRDILDGETDVFIGVPLEMLETQPQFARIVITALLHEVMRAHGAVEKRILYILDEMPRLGYLPVLETSQAALAGMGASIWAIVQSYHQLEARWDSAKAKAFFEGFNVFQYFGITPGNATRVADLIGKTTIVDRTTTKGAGDSQQMDRIAGTWSSNQGESITHKERHLITADELRTLSMDQIIIQTVGQPPLRAKRVKYYEHPHFTGKFDPNPYQFTGGV